MNEQAALTDKNWYKQLYFDVVLEGKRPRTLTRKLTAEQAEELRASLDNDIKVLENYKEYLTSMTTPVKLRSGK